MKAPNSARINTENDTLTYDSIISNDENNSNVLNNINYSQTEQLRLRRNLIQSKYPIKKTQSPNKLSEESSLIKNIPEKPNIPLIDFQKAYSYFKSQIYPNGIRNEAKNDCCSCDSQKIKSQKNFIMILSRLKYDQNNQIHFQILFTIYYFFTKKNCTKEGEHWQDIGFQSDTPSVDLFTVGMLGPLQILYGINKYPLLYTQLFDYLLKKKCDLYFMVNMLSLCKFSLNTLERGLLDDLVNENNDLFIYLNEIYVGMGYEYNLEITNYGNKNELTIEFIVKTIQNISDMRKQVNRFINNHGIAY